MLFPFLGSSGGEVGRDERECCQETPPRVKIAHHVRGRPRRSRRESCQDCQVNSSNFGRTSGICSTFVVSISGRVRAQLGISHHSFFQNLLQFPYSYLGTSLLALFVFSPSVFHDSYLFGRALLQFPPPKVISVLSFSLFTVT